MTKNGAIAQLKELRDNSMMPSLFKHSFDKVIETVSELEEPKHGEWMWGVKKRKCSICGEIIHIRGYIELKFCPNCGAKMDI